MGQMVVFSVQTFAGLAQQLGHAINCAFLRLDVGTIRALFLYCSLFFWESVCSPKITKADLPCFSRHRNRHSLARLDGCPCSLLTDRIILDLAGQLERPVVSMIPVVMRNVKPYRHPTPI